MDGGEWQTGTVVPLPPHRKGGIRPTQIDYYSVDTRGAVEAVRTCFVKVDVTPPLTVSSVDDEADSISATDVAVTLFPSDVQAAIAATFFRVDLGDWQNGTSLVVPAPADSSNDGLHVVDYYSVDRVGNTEVERTCWVTIAARSSVAAASRLSFLTPAALPYAHARATAGALLRHARPR